MHTLPLGRFAVDRHGVGMNLSGLPAGPMFVTAYLACLRADTHRQARRAGKNERHHADEFWALALAIHAAGLAKEHRRPRRQVTASIV